MAKSSLKDSFVKKLKAALKSDKAATALNRFIKRSITSEEDLLECLWQYCMNFSSEWAGVEESAKYRGLAAGYSLFSRAIELAAPLNNLAELIPRLLRAVADRRAEPDQVYLVYTDRWTQLSDVDRSRLVQLAKKKRGALRDRQTIVSPLIEAFIKKTGGRPTLEALYDFDPADASLRKEFDATALSCADTWKQYNTNAANIRPTDKSLRELDTAFQGFAIFLREKASEPLVLFQVLKWIREGAGLKPTRVEGEQKFFESPPWSVIWQELYLDASFHAIRMAADKWNLLAVQRAKALPPEDADFFLAAHKDPREQERLEARLKWGFRDVAGFLEVNRARRRYDRFAAHANLQLLDELETVRLLNHIASEQKKHPDALRKLFVRVNDVHVAFRDRYTVNQQILEDFTIVWIEPSAAKTGVVVEFHNMDCVLFRTDQDGLGKLVKNAFYKALARNAEALKVFLLAYLELLGLVVDVISAGSVGGFRRFAFEFVKERVKDKVTDETLVAAGVENPVVRAAAGMGVNFVRLPTRAKPAAGLDLDAQRSAAIGDRGTSSDPAPYTAAELEALRKSDVTVGDFMKKQPDRVALVRDKDVALDAEDEQAVAVAMAGGSRSGGGYVRPTRSSAPARDMDLGPPSLSSRSTRARRQPPAESVPEPHPYTDRPPSKYTPEHMRWFYTSNLGQYPEHIQQMIRKLPPAASGRLPTADSVVAIDRAIRKEHTALANRMAGYGRATEKPFTNSVRALSNEGNRFSSAVTDQKGLSCIGQLKSGGTVEFDSIGFRSNALTETKMNLAFKTQQDVYDQMRRQARFAQDWKFSQVRWEVWDATDVVKARTALEQLRADHPDLAARIEVRNPANAY